MSDTTNNNQLDILVVGAPVDRIIFRNNTAKDPERDMEILANIVLEAWLEAVDIVENSPLLESADSSNVSYAIPSEEEAFADFSDIVSDALAHKPVITKRQRSEEGNYVVQPGDTLYTLARKFNTTVYQLMMMNNIDDDNRDNIYVGERLWVPVGTPTAVEEPLFGNIDLQSFVSPAVRDYISIYVRGRYPLYYRVGERLQAIVSKIRNVQNTETGVPLCNKEHIDLRPNIAWVSQHSLARPNVACKRACDIILNNVGLASTTSADILHQVAREDKTSTSKDQSVYLKIDTDVAKRSIDYIDEQLELGHPVLVGVDHTFDRKNSAGNPLNSDDTTDHFIVIIGRGYQDDKAYYLFYEVAAKVEDEMLGKSDSNRLYVHEDYSLRGIPATNTSRNYVVTQVRKNRPK